MGIARTAEMEPSPVRIQVPIHSLAVVSRYTGKNMVKKPASPTILLIICDQKSTSDADPADDGERCIAKTKG